MNVSSLLEAVYGRPEGARAVASDLLERHPLCTAVLAFWCADTDRERFFSVSFPAFRESRALSLSPLSLHGRPSNRETTPSGGRSPSVAVGLPLQRSQSLSLSMAAFSPPGYIKATTPASEESSRFVFLAAVAMAKMMWNNLFILAGKLLCFWVFLG